MTYRVTLSRRAERDIRTIRDWIKARSVSGASRWLDVLEDALLQLPLVAATCVAAVEAVEIGLDLRQRIFKTRRGHPYRLVFLIRNETIQVLAVRGSGQDLLQPDDIDEIE